MNLRISIGMAALLALPLAAGAQDSAPTTAQPVSRAAPDIEIGDLIARYARRSGKQFIVDPRVHAQVPLAGLDPDKVGYDKLLAILSVNMFAAVAQGDWIVVVPDASARQLPTPVYTERSFKTGAPDELVTLVLTVKNIGAPQAVPVLRPLMPQAAHMAAFPDTNTLILSDRASNLHRIVTVIEALERTGDKNPQSAGDCAGRFEAKSVSK